MQAIQAELATLIESLGAGTTRTTETYDSLVHAAGRVHARLRGREYDADVELWLRTAAGGAQQGRIGRNGRGSRLKIAGQALAGATGAAFIPYGLGGLTDQAVGTEDEEAVEGAGEPAVVGNREHGSLVGLQAVLECLGRL